MPAERIFLGWDGPCLLKAAAWLRDHRPPVNNQWDLGDLLLVLPASRAARRTLELLIEHARPAAIIPPRIITTGQLPETLYRPTSPIADDLHALLARVASLRAAPRDLLSVIAPHPPEPDDLPGWIALAEDLAQLHRTLAGEGIPIRDVAPRCEAALDFTDADRWDALAQLERNYEAALAAAGLTDRDLARLTALDQNRCDFTGQVILIATLELPAVTRQMLRQIPGQVTALIHAPDSEAHAFDDLGCLIPDHWHNRPIAIPDDHLHVVDRPRDQALASVRLITELFASNQYFSPDHATLGIGDSKLAPTLERTLSLASIPARPATGRPLRLTRPALLLAALARYLADRRLDDFAALLRHPDIQNFLHDPDNAIEDWLTLLDRYITDHLQTRSTDHWLGDPADAAKLKSLHDEIHALVPPDANQPHPLPHWSAPIAHILNSIYGNRTLQRFDPDDSQLIRALTMLADALREQFQLDPTGKLTPRLTLSQTINFTLSRLDDAALPAETPGPAVEMLGWLELQLDDAPALVITSVNEGLIPQSQNADAFLPDHIRRVLGLVDNHRRYARDLAIFQAILHSRPFVRLIAGRRGEEGDPLIPSRLLLACPPDQLPARVRRFFGKESAETPPQPPPLLLNPGKVSQFYVPAPTPPDKPLETLRVTAFRDYLNCPYRFYLKYVRKLEALDDRAIEMDALHFGTLAHCVLQDLGESNLADSTDQKRLTAFLVDRLEHHAATNFSDQPTAAVLVQHIQLRERLIRFASWQAGQAAQGWRMLPGLVERQLSATFNVDNLPFTVTGRIDRIDQHDQHGYRILDYKTGESPADPERDHRAKVEGQPKWTGLQLPLYLNLAQQLHVTGAVSLGYIRLSKDPDTDPLALADWDEPTLQSAFDAAHQVIRNIRNGVFWPPADPQTIYADDFSDLCHDRDFDRAHALSQGNKASRGGRGK